MTLKPTLIIILSIFSTLSFAQQKISLNSDNRNIQWKVKPQSDINSDSAKIFSRNYNSNEWVAAMVPGNLFTCYVNAGI